MSALKQNRTMDFFKQNAIYVVLLVLLIVIIA
ncbi:beta-methylgalactoside transporter inner membrane protein [Actinobacillus ureae]|nr:beta-methylgalactoside transporter inner membrane protein [Actinobacillus ureae]SUU49981.1 beta-methylgalactoside transporter inner membrane protein [Actinobacillus ureae]